MDIRLQTMWQNGASIAHDNPQPDAGDRGEGDERAERFSDFGMARAALTAAFTALTASD